MSCSSLMARCSYLNVVCDTKPTNRSVGSFAVRILRKPGIGLNDALLITISCSPLTTGAPETASGLPPPRASYA